MRGLGNDARYWEALADGRLNLPRCAGCQKWSWPAPYRCGDCGSWDFLWVDVDMEGEVYSWTRVHHPFAGAEALGLPYVTVSIALPNAGGIRLFGTLANQADARIGLKVRGHVVAAHAFEQSVPAIKWSATS